MFTAMDEWSEIRRRVLVEGVSQRQIQRETGLHWTTIKKVLAHSEPPGYRQEKARPKRKLGAHEEWIAQVLKEDQEAPVKQRHTAWRIFERLRDERGYAGGYTPQNSKPWVTARLCAGYSTTFSVCRNMAGSGGTTNKRGFTPSPASSRPSAVV